MAVTQEEGGGAFSGGRGHVDAGRAWWRLPGYHPEPHRRATAVGIRSFLPPKTPTACNRACYWLGRPGAGRGADPAGGCSPAGPQKVGTPPTLHFKVNSVLRLLQTIWCAAA